ncbi:MAG TPA: type 1 glutamine amidotransferase family protein [Longimicrobium sp.]|nr:type 1 glutamine amidotransferase family protein [Longimicrobium sp.]
MQPQTVHLFVYDTLADWEPGYAIAGINNPAWQAQPGRYRVRTVGAGTGTVTSAGGVTIVPDMAAADLQPGESAMLILPGGDVWDHGGVPGAVEKAREFLAAGVPVAAICGATAGLARGGLLDDVDHTSNAPEYLAATGYAGAARYRAEPAVRDGLLITAPGTAPLEFAREIFRALGLYEPRMLDAWYALFKTGDASHFYALAGEEEQTA